MPHNYLILGLARSGMAALRWLVQRGHTVYISDGDSTKVDAAVAEGGIAWTDESDFKKLATLIQSPGIPLTHPLTMAAQAQGVLVIGDIDLFRHTHPTAKIVGITGTNGKSTITTLIGHILKECDIPVAIGGNVGVAAMSLPDLSDKGIYVLELSSYQLDLSQSPSLGVAAWTNITPDHLERHGTMENYVYAKSKIFASKAAPPLTAISIDDDYSKEVYERMNAAHPGYFTPISVMRPLITGVFIFEGMLVDATGNERLNLGEISNLERLKGIHNYQNIAIAYTVCKNLGLKATEILAAIKTFPGLAHRQEQVAIMNGVTFINDSKGTNAEATTHALSAYDSIYWIVGGVAKSEGITPLLPLLSRVKKAYLIGESSDQFAQTLADRVPWEACGTLPIAVEKAYADARSLRGSTILLSPACASFDQFKDFEHRGDVFKEIVRGIVKS
ncbi:UDP-N-acetylmuramoyl-L-alanine--D-glutamate ligase [Candidatus Odyssella acanthamoebae]|uniref:UDP-N-acetylmuramoyl-L-alanine--D-glutamate ligase n=1 Tax=Candidatus Odyssella acanthamoebae TaxID=91604 RepID=UPI000689A7BE|nr:UDP-N-acetylmuramoyl-L-alanine--D-glutamate ligase [Candidatus Paracaedibacter acanthamoebae]